MKRAMKRAMKRKGSPVRNGPKDGKDRLSTDSGVLEGVLEIRQYSLGTGFGDGKGTHAGELIAAAGAGRFSMALSGRPGKAGLTAEHITTTARLDS